MGKNIVILCDGTSNQISYDRTNILRLFGCLKKNDKQVVFYDPEVGTFGAEDSPFRAVRKAAEVWGLATGWGLDTNVKEAYRFIIKHYNHGGKTGTELRDSDKIYIFGFSRGAYTARVLAGFIHAIGLLHPDNMNLLDYAYREYKGISEVKDTEQDNTSANAFSGIRLYERTLRPIRPRIHFLGLFDTVASIIESGKWLFRLRSHAFTSTNRSVAHVRHAVAMDECRTMFQPRLWPCDQPYRSSYWDAGSEVAQDAQEIWFHGCHCDVGGGLPEKESALAKVPLLWMIEEAKTCGLELATQTVNHIVSGKARRNETTKYVQPDPNAKIHDSMSGLWPILEYLPRRKSRYIQTNRTVICGFFLPRKEHRIIPENATIYTPATKVKPK